MGTKERHDRERETVRAAILTAARDLFTTEGYRNVSMRKIAERIEYSPAAIYSYFSSKDAIFFALAAEGFHLMGQYGAAVLASTDGDPIETLRNGFGTYYRFSREQPEYFDLMFVDRTVPQISEQWDRFSMVHEWMHHIARIVRRGMDAGIFPSSTNPDVACHVLWAAVHGPAVIGLANRLAPCEDPDALARDTLEAALAGLQRGFPSTFVPESCSVDAASAAGESANAAS
jgi:AcrR family transcriptional regulator